MPRRTLRAAAGVGGLILLLGTSACGGPVEIAVPELDRADAAACAALTADLPDTLAELERVDSEPAEAPGAAYGDPPIVVTCGVAAPEGWDTAGSCELVNDVGWWAPEEQFGDEDLDLTLYSAGYRPVVEIQVPAEIKVNAGAAAMAALAAPVEAHTELVDVCD